MAFKRLAIGNDHTAIDMKNEIMAYVREKGIEVINVGTDSPERFNYPVSGYKVARMVADGEVDGGILICGTGVGISLSAQQHQHRGLRCPRGGYRDRQGHRGRVAWRRVRGRPSSGAHRHDRGDRPHPAPRRSRGVGARDTNTYEMRPQGLWSLASAYVVCCLMPSRSSALHVRTNLKGLLVTGSMRSFSSSSLEYFLAVPTEHSKQSAISASRTLGTDVKRWTCENRYNNDLS